MWYVRVPSSDTWYRAATPCSHDNLYCVSLPLVKDTSQCPVGNSNGISACKTF